MTYDKEFEEIISSTVIDSRWTMEDRLWFVWQAARKDHYRIGEEVESRYNGNGWTRSVVGVYQGTMYKDEVRLDVRRIPAKSRIDEIAEEAVFNYLGDTRMSKSELVEIVKSAILKDREERGEK